MAWGVRYIFQLFSTASMSLLGNPFMGKYVPQLEAILCLIKLELRMVKVTFTNIKEGEREEPLRSFSNANWMSRRTSKHLKGSSPTGIVALCVYSRFPCCGQQLKIQTAIVSTTAPTNSNCKLWSECPQRTHKGRPEDAAQLHSIVMRMRLNDAAKLL